VNLSKANLSYIAGLHDHFNRGRLSIEAFFSQSKGIKKLSKWKKEKGLAEKKPR